MSGALFAKNEDWHARWSYTQTGTVLHRLVWVESLEDWEDQCCGKGRSACGYETLFSIPGLFSRMGLKRCERCCTLEGIPQGIGAPYNEGIQERGCEPVPNRPKPNPSGAEGVAPRSARVSSVKETK